MRLLSTLRKSKGQTPPVIVFPHVPKTAGQTVIAALERIYPAAAFSPVRTHAAAAQDAQLPPGYRLYAGHIDWVDLETLPKDRFAFTVLRDPRERIASFYFYTLREAAKLTPEELASKARTNMRMVSALSADDYFFGGGRPWQRFIHDHYDNFYCNYLATRKIRGWKDMADLDPADLVARATEGARALQGVYSIDALGTLEHDLEQVLGARPRIEGTYVNAGPEPTTARRWDELCARFERDESVRRLEGFARQDSDVMAALGLT